MQTKAFGVWQEVLDDALDILHDTLTSMDGSDAKGEKFLFFSKLDDLKTWLSLTITIIDQETCLDALDEVNTTDLICDAMDKPTQFASNHLAKHKAVAFSKPRPPMSNQFVTITAQGKILIKTQASAR